MVKILGMNRIKFRHVPKNLNATLHSFQDWKIRFGERVFSPLKLFAEGTEGFPSRSL